MGKVSQEVPIASVLLKAPLSVTIVPWPLSDGKEETLPVFCYLDSFLSYMIENK